VRAPRIGVGRIAAIIISVIGSPAIAHDSVPPLAIRLEHAGTCSSCPSYLLGFLADGSSYHVGRTNVRALATRGSYVRKNGFFYETPVLAAAYARTVRWLPKNRAALSAWLEEARAAALFKHSRRGETCNKLRGHTGIVVIDVDFGGYRGTSRTCYDPSSPDVVTKLVAALHAIYEYPDDFAVAPPFDESPFVLRFGHIWEDGGRGVACTSGSPEDYVLHVAPDRSVTVFGRRSVYGHKDVPLVTVSTKTFASEEEIRQLREEVLELRNLNPRNLKEPQVVMAGAAELPKLTLTLHAKDLITGEIYDLTSILNPHVPQSAQDVLNGLRRIAKPLIDLLPQAEGLKAYCQSRPPRV